MQFLRRLPTPRRLPPRLWLVSLPAALLSFERRQRLPRLPNGPWRYLGVPLVASGAILALWSWRDPQAALPGPPPLGRRPGVVAGLLVLAGVALLLRSLALAAYSLALAFAAGTDTLNVEEPRPGTFLGRDHDEV
ncbi:MAG TPA: hypothetical protein VFT91_09805 [Dehalococcoidia bacterium]|nr:hypothetical protein [Dehalococcoidia bacterium]